MSKRYVDYIPTKDKDLVSFGKNFETVISNNLTKWNISQNEYTEIANAVKSFEASVNLAYSPARTKPITLRKNKNRTNLVAKIRELVNFKLRNPVITDDDKTSLKLHIKDPTKTPIGRPETIPFLYITGAGNRQLKLSFHDQPKTEKNDKKSKAKPYGISGAFIVYDILDEKPETQSKLTKVLFATRTPQIIIFQEEERGKKAYFAICWQNIKGERGTWSDIMPAFIP
ncbi:MAG: hypothetical protein LBF79_02890 [Dysgonamonadaceae bacterium]|jgi:hypothetical protein|nr:hypothetical protein [Dysgonamonadaceae bacterium]